MTTNDPTKVIEVSAERLAALLESYGAKPSRWPEAERAPAMIRLNTDTAAHGRVRGSAALDLALDKYEVPGTSAALEERILGDFDSVLCRQSRLSQRLRRAAQPVLDIVWPDAPPWKPAVALAFSVIVGIVAGVVIQPTEFPRDPGDSGTLIADDGTTMLDVDQDN